MARECHGEAPRDPDRARQGELWGGEQLQQAIAQGRTLDALNLQAGDRIVVPEKGTAAGAQSTVQVISLLVTLPVAIYGLIKILKF